jgi:hypothetical protein
MKTYLPTTAKLKNSILKRMKKLKTHGGGQRRNTYFYSSKQCVSLMAIITLPPKLNKIYIINARSHSNESQIQNFERVDSTGTHEAKTIKLGRSIDTQRCVKSKRGHGDGSIHTTGRIFTMSLAHSSRAHSGEQSTHSNFSRNPKGRFNLQAAKFKTRETQRAIQTTTRNNPENG